MLIRPITFKDNPKIATIIRAVLLEHDAPKTGSALADSSLDCMYESYTKPKTIYFVLENNGEIIGGAGIAPLENGAESVCELQKMYFSKIARGKGYGEQMILKCLQFAKEQGFTSCYLETLPNMFAAQKLYQKVGFVYLDAPMGCTGHGNCPVWMLKDLD